LGFPLERSITSSLGSDLLRLIEDELRRYPNSCFSKNVVAWYNALHRALSYSGDCSYQVQINQSLCDQQFPTSANDVIADIVFLGSLVDRREALRMNQYIFRTARRMISESKAGEV